MVWLKRISLFFLVNILVMVTISLFISVLNAFGFRMGTGTIQGLALFSMVWGFSGALVSLLLSRWMAKLFHGVRVIEPQQAMGKEVWLLQTVHRLARNAGLPAMPEVGVYESDEVNAFATGPSKSRALVAVSRGILERFSEADLEAVLGHEIAHVANGDMVTMTLIQGVVNSFVIFISRLLAWAASQSVEEKNRFWVSQVTYILSSILLTVLGSLVTAYFSRRREFRADAGGARFAGREKMISALQSLRRTHELIDPNDSALATLKVSGTPKFLTLFSTHPPLEERIEALQRQTVQA